MSLPTNTAEERLLAKAAPQLTPAPDAVDIQDLVEEVSHAICEHLPDRDPLLLATDGAAKDLVGAFSVVVQKPTCRFAAGDAGEDQSAYRVELMAIHLALQSAAQAVVCCTHVRCRTIFLVVDCLSAMQAIINGAAPSEYQHLLNQIRDHRRALDRHGLAVVFVWTPSHDKRPDWRPAVDLDPGQLRAFNAAADKGAGVSMERRRCGSLRHRWAAVAAEACAWEVEALQHNEQIAEAFHSFLKQSGKRPRE